MAQLEARRERVKMNVARKLLAFIFDYNLYFSSIFLLECFIMTKFSLL